MSNYVLRKLKFLLRYGYSKEDFNTTENWNVMLYVAVVKLIRRAVRLMDQGRNARRSALKQEETVQTVAVVQLMGRHVRMTQRMMVPRGNVSLALHKEEIVPALAVVQLLGRHVRMTQLLLVPRHVSLALMQKETVPTLGVVQKMGRHVPQILITLPIRNVKCAQTQEETVQ